MDSILPAIGSKLALPAAKTYYDRSSGATLRPVFPTPRPSKLNRICKTIRANAERESAVAIDFSDPDWKSKYQKDFETRFHIPHLTVTDAFDDAVSYPSTFCLKMRTPVTEDFADGYPSDEKWHGYINNNNDRVLLKVHGAFAGYSGITVGICNTHYVYLPIPEVISYPKLLDPYSRMWHRCLTSTSQPDFV